MQWHVSEVIQLLVERHRALGWDMVGNDDLIHLGRLAPSKSRGEMVLSTLSRL
jgi:hypothetical protein